MPRMFAVLAQAAETFTAAAAGPGVDAQGWAQTAAQILVPIAVVLYIELVTVPRTQRKIAAENAVRDEALQQRLDAANAEQEQRLHQVTLEHSARVALDARYGQALFELRDLVQQARAELWAVQTEVVQGSAAPWSGLRRLQFLLESCSEDAVYLSQQQIGSCVDAALEALRLVLNDEEKFRDVAGEVEGFLGAARFAAALACRARLESRDTRPTIG